MSEKDKTMSNVLSGIDKDEQWGGIDSPFRLIVVAALRSKQLMRGSPPRIEADPKKRRNTSIAIEEVKQGLVPFTLTDGKQAPDSDDSKDSLLRAAQENYRGREAYLMNRLR